MDDAPIIDISKIIAPDTAVWPGDRPVAFENRMSIKAGDIVNLTTITFSAHTASHADAPFHVVDDDLTLDQVDLQIYWGPAQVVTVHKQHGPLLPDDFSDYDLSLAPRLLVRTPAGRLFYNQFPEVIPYPSPELSNFLRSFGIILYGTDTPSMDAIDSTTLPGHHAMVRNRIAILEGLDLRHAEDGLYELSALPLKIAGGDGSPVRAALRRISGS